MFTYSAKYNCYVGKTKCDDDALNVKRLLESANHERHPQRIIFSFLEAVENLHFFRQINVFTNKVTKEMISRNFLSVIAFYSTFPHCAIEVKHEIPLVLVLLHITICFFQSVVHFSSDFHVTFPH